MTYKDMYKSIFYSLLFSVLGFFLCIFILISQRFEGLDILAENLVMALWSPLFTKIALFLTTIAGTKGTLGISALLIAYLLLKERWRDALILTFTGSLVVLSVYGVKHLFGIERPVSAFIEESGFRFPSGHATASMYIALSALFTFRRNIQGWLSRSFVLITIFAFIGIIGATRVFLNVHKTVDVFAGYFLALICFTTALVLFGRYSLK